MAFVRALPLTLLATCFAATAAHAVCRLTPNPGLFCGLGLTAIRATVQSTDAGVLTVLVVEVAGQPLDGIAPGFEVPISPDATDSPDLIVPPLSGDAIFIMQDSSTFVQGAPINENDRVPITNFGSETLPASYLLAMATDEDADRCREVAFELVDPPVNPNPGPCDDEIGCSSLPAHVLTPFALLLLIIRRSRQPLKNLSSQGIT